MADFGDFSSGDPTADFLARERAILGDAAAEFSGASTSTATGAASSGLPPEMANFPPVDAFATGGSASGTTGTADIFGTSSIAPVTTVADGTDVFGAAPVATGGAGPWVPPATMGMSLPLPSSPAQGSSIMGGQSPVSTTTSTPAPAMPEMETDAIRQWRESFNQTIAERDAAEARAKADQIAKAKADIDKFYEEYNTKRERALQESKVLQERMVADMNDTQSGTFWERVVKNIEIVSTAGGSSKAGDKAAPAGADTGAKMPSNAAKKQPGGQAAGNQKDVTRFKQVLLALKADKNTAPGA